MFWYKFIQTLLWVPSKILLPTKVIGKNNLPKGGAVLICNHQSALDIAIIGLNIYKQQKFLGKKELFEKKFKANLYKALGCIPINREKPELSSVKECIKVLKNDQRLLVFPEGTRKQNNDLENIKLGVAIFAIKAKKPIIPMWIEKKPKLLRFNTLKIGKPIYLEEYYDKKITDQEMQQIEKRLKNNLLELKNQSSK